MFNPWVRKIPWRRKWQPTPVFLLENPMDRGTWWAAVHGDHKESDTTKGLTHTHTLLILMNVKQNEHHEIGNMHRL